MVGNRWKTDVFGAPKFLIHPWKQFIQHRLSLSIYMSHIYIYMYMIVYDIFNYIHTYGSELWDPKMDVRRL